MDMVAFMTNQIGRSYYLQTTGERVDKTFAWKLLGVDHRKGQTYWSTGINQSIPLGLNIFLFHINGGIIYYGLDWGASYTTHFVPVELIDGGVLE